MTGSLHPRQQGKGPSAPGICRGPGGSWASSVLRPLPSSPLCSVSEHGTRIKSLCWPRPIPELRNPFSCYFQRGYDDLQTIVPTCQQQDFSIGSPKLSKAIVLQKSMTGVGVAGLSGSGWYLV